MQIGVGLSSKQLPLNPGGQKRQAVDQERGENRICAWTSGVSSGGRQAKPSFQLSGFNLLCCPVTFFHRSLWLPFTLTGKCRICRRCYRGEGHFSLFPPPQHMYILLSQESVVRSRQLLFRFLAAYKVVQQLEKELERRGKACVIRMSCMLRIFPESQGSFGFWAQFRGLMVSLAYPSTPGWHQHSLKGGSCQVGSTACGGLPLLASTHPSTHLPGCMCPVSPLLASAAVGETCLLFSAALSKGLDMHVVGWPSCLQ